jgi:hypothetical protein
MDLTGSEQNLAQGMDFQNFPFLTQEEFRDTCHYLDRRYTQAPLGDLRKHFKLEIMGVMFSDDIWVQIIRPIIVANSNDEALSRALEKLGMGGDVQTSMDVDAEDADLVRNFLSSCMTLFLSCYSCSRRNFLYKIDIHLSYNSIFR